MRDPTEIGLEPIQTSSVATPAGHPVGPSGPGGTWRRALGRIVTLAVFVLVIGLVVARCDAGDPADRDDREGQDPSSVTDPTAPATITPGMTIATTVPTVPTVSSVPTVSTVPTTATPANPTTTPTSTPTTTPTTTTTIVPTGTGPTVTPTTGPAGAGTTLTTAPPAPESPVRVRELGRPLAFGRTDTVVVGLAVGADLVEIELDTGTLRRTRLPDPVPDSADVNVLATESATVVAGTAQGERVVYLVPVGEPARPAAGALDAEWVRIERGPSPDTVWLSQPDGEPVLVGILDGRPVDPAPLRTDQERSPGPDRVVARPAPDGGTTYELTALDGGDPVVLIRSHRPGQGISEAASIEWSNDGDSVLFLDGLRLVQLHVPTGQRILVGGVADLMQLRRFSVRPAG